MYLETDSTMMASHTVHDPHLPFVLVFGDEKDLYRHMGFYVGDTSLLELGTDFNSKEVGKLTLILSENHANIDEAINMPECEEGRLRYEMPRHVECDRFDTMVYEDGVAFLLSTSTPTAYFRCAQAVFGFNDENRIVEIIVGDMKPDEVSHLRNSLNEIDETRDKVLIFNGEEWVEGNESE